MVLSQSHVVEPYLEIVQIIEKKSGNLQLEDFETIVGAQLFSEVLVEKIHMFLNFVAISIEICYNTEFEVNNRGDSWLLEK